MSTHHTGKWDYIDKGVMFRIHDKDRMIFSAELDVLTFQIIIIFLAVNRAWTRECL